MVAKAFNPFQVIILSGAKVYGGPIWHRRLTSGCESPHTPLCQVDTRPVEGLHADADRRSKEDAVSVWFCAPDYAWPVQLGGVLQRDLETHHRTHHAQPRQHIVYWSAQKHTHMQNVNSSIQQTSLSKQTKYLATAVLPCSLLTNHKCSRWQLTILCAPSPSLL